MSMGKYLDRQIRIKNAINSEINLTKDGEKFSKADLPTIDKYLNQFISQQVLDVRQKIIEINKKINKANEFGNKTEVTKLRAEKSKFKGDFTPVLDLANYNHILGIACNENLDPEHIKMVFTTLKTLEIFEKSSDISEGTKTKNTGLRGKIRKALAIHKNLDDDTINQFLLSGPIDSPVLGNSKLTDTHLNTFFKIRILPQKPGDTLSTIGFEHLMEAVSLNPEIVSKWYDENLKSFAKWDYSDTKWYSIVGSLLKYEFLPEYILAEIASVPSIAGHRGWAKTYRDKALAHPNASKRVIFEAFKISKDISLLPINIRSWLVF